MLIFKYREGQQVATTEVGCLILAVHSENGGWANVRMCTPIRVFTVHDYCPTGCGRPVWSKSVQWNSARCTVLKMITAAAAAACSAVQWWQWRLERFSAENSHGRRHAASDQQQQQPQLSARRWADVRRHCSRLDFSCRRSTVVNTSGCRRQRTTSTPAAAVSPAHLTAASELAARSLRSCWPSASPIA